MIFVRGEYCTEASASFARAQAQVSSASEQGAVDVTPEEARYIGTAAVLVAQGAAATTGRMTQGITKKGPNNNIWEQSLLEVLS